MTAVLELWLPILVSTIAVYAASFVLHTVLNWHKGEYPAVPDEAKVMSALRPFSLPPGDYFVPRAAEVKEMRTPEFQEKLKAGPVLTMTVYPNGQPPMGRSLALWFLYVLVVGIFAAYITGRALGSGAVGTHIFRFAWTTSFLAYSAALWQMSIWYRRAWRTTIMATVDGIIYAILTGLVFCWLWPR